MLPEIQIHIYVYVETRITSNPAWVFSFALLVKQQTFTQQNVLNGCNELLFSKIGRQNIVTICLV